jgi:integrase
MICHVFRRGGVYWGKLRLPGDAHPTRFTLGTTDRRIAQAKLLETVREREREAAGLLAPSTVRAGVSMPVAGLLAEFLAQLSAQGRMPATVRKYRSDVNRCVRGCGWKVLGDLKEDSFEYWMAHTSHSRKSIKDSLGALRAFAAWLVFKRLLLGNPFARRKWRIDLRGAAQYRRALLPGELVRFLGVVPEYRRVFYVTAVRTGLRRKELKLLCWGDISLERAVLRVRAATAKNRKDAVLPLCGELVELLTSYRPENVAPFTPVFPRVPNFKTVQRDFRAAGIPLVDESGRRVDLHALRVTFGTHLMLSGASLYEAKELMRHSDIKLTLKTYVDAGQIQLAPVVAKLPVLGVSKNVSKTCPNGGLGQTQVAAS